MIAGRGVLDRPDRGRMIIRFRLTAAEVSGAPGARQLRFVKHLRAAVDQARVTIMGTKELSFSRRFSSLRMEPVLPSVERSAFPNRPRLPVISSRSRPLSSTLERAAQNSHQTELPICP